MDIKETREEIIKRSKIVKARQRQRVKKMLDIKILRTEPERIKEALKNRNNDLDIAPAIELDAKRRFGQ